MLLLGKRIGASLFAFLCLYTLPVHLVVLWGCFSGESKLLIQSSVIRVDSLKCKNFFPGLSVIFGTAPWFLESKKLPKSCWVLCCTHGGAPAPVSCRVAGFWNPGQAGKPWTKTFFLLFHLLFQGLIRLSFTVYTAFPPRCRAPLK